MNSYSNFHRIRSASLLIIILLLLLFEAIGAFAYDLENRVKKVTLSNGLRLLLVERHTTPTVSLVIRHGVGAVDETSGATGTAHFLEHLMFKGTTTIGAKNYAVEKMLLDEIWKTGKALDEEINRGDKGNADDIASLRRKLSQLQDQSKKLFISNEIDRIYTETGAVDLNASTGQDVTTYHVSLPANKIELWARIEADRMMNPVFREFYAERDVIMEERRQSVESDPEGKLVEQYLATSFQAHPYGRPVLGWPSDMAVLNPELISAFFKLYHAPNNTVIAIVGDIDVIKTIKTVKKYFGKIPKREIRRTHITEEPPQKGERRVEVFFEANPQLIIGYHKPTLPSFDDYVFDVIDSLLSEGRTSRFYKKIVTEKGLAESIQTANGWPGVRFPNLFSVFATSRHPHSIAELEASILEEIEQIKNKEVSEAELARIKNRMQSDFIRGLSSNLGLASKLSYYEMLAGDWHYLPRHIDIIEKITPSDIIRVARKYLIAENRTVASLLKKIQN